MIFSAPSIRNTVRAIIIRDGRILLQKKQDDADNIRYTLPGGAQEIGESLVDALQRECQEEIASAVEINDIVHIADYFKPKDPAANLFRHQLEILFYCEIAAEYIPQNGPKPDKHQVAVEWLPIHQLSQYPFSPEFLIPFLSSLHERSDRHVYQGPH